MLEWYKKAETTATVSNFNAVLGSFCNEYKVSDTFITKHLEDENNIRIEIWYNFNVQRAIAIAY